jgi:hypothetical protein
LLIDTIVNLCKQSHMHNLCGEEESLNFWNWLHVDNQSWYLFIYLIYLMVLGFVLRTSHMLSRCSTIPAMILHLIVHGAEMSIENITNHHKWGTPFMSSFQVSCFSSSDGVLSLKDEGWYSFCLYIKNPLLSCLNLYYFPYI